MEANNANANTSDKKENEYSPRQEESPDNSDATSTSNNSSPKTQETSDDPMLGFLTLLAKVERPSCSNCELKDVSPMFYCNTCAQAICSVCKKNTHSAKMFSRHDISSVSPYTREPQRKCLVHHEVCIMFSPANESLLCINCFRDLPPDIRAQCLDLDSAYTQKVERLEKGLKAVGELEITIKDEATAYKDLLKELHINAMREESTVHVFSKILQGVITQTEEKLIESLKKEVQSKEMVFEEKLATLESLQSNVQAYLTLSSAFINSASKYELLKLANGLVERLSDIGAIVQPSKISPENSWISSNFKAEYSQSLKEMFHKDMWMQDLLDIKLSTAPGKVAEGKKPEVESVVATDYKNNCQKEGAAYKRIPLPFLGKSQSLLNIPLNLDANEIDSSAFICHAVAAAAVAADAYSPPRRLTKRKQVPQKCQSLPKDCNKKSSQRSKSVDASQVLASIQLRRPVRVEKKMSITPITVPLPRPDRPDEEKKKQLDKNLMAPAPAPKNPPAGNLCVVQAMVHQDGDSLRKQRKYPEPFQPASESMNAMRKVEKAGPDSSGSSIELTADQVRQLIRAISAAQNNNREDKNSWNVPVKEVPEKRDLRSLQRNDSFEGHEQAVRMLVDAVHEIQQICTTKGSRQHF